MIHSPHSRFYLPTAVIQPHNFIHWQCALPDSNGQATWRRGRPISAENFEDCRKIPKRVTSAPWLLSK